MKETQDMNMKRYEVNVRESALQPWEKHQFTNLEDGFPVIRKNNQKYYPSFQIS